MDTLSMTIYGVLGIFILLSLSLSVYILLFFRKLSKGVGKNDLIKILGKLADIEKENSESIKSINRAISEIKSDVSNHIQKVALVRFNPFSELGGDHSFSMALLDLNLTGLVITGLHTRERTRVYVKKIEKGKCKQELSKEEKEVLKKASH